MAFALTAVLILLAAFLVTFIVFFPGQPLRDRLERTVWQQSGEEVTIGGLTLVPPAGLLLTKIGWQPRIPDWPAVTIESARISPRWATLLSSNPAAAFQAALPTGSLKGRMSKDGSLDADFAGIVLRSLLPAGLSYRPEGTVEGRIQGSQMLLPDKRQAAFELIFDQLAVSGLEALGASSGRLALGRMNVSGELRGQTLDIQELSNSDGDVRLQGKAVLLLGTSPDRCRVTARIDITPGPKLDPMLRDLLPLSGIKPDAQGAYRFRIGGTLSHPVLR